jgi:hypothetical protein
MSESAFGSISVQGLFNTEIQLTSTVTTTSASNAVITGLTTTPPAGIYLVQFGGWFTHSTGNATITISIFAGGSQNAGSVRTFVPFTGAVGGANNGIEAGTNAIVTVNGTGAIAAEWLTSASTATIHVANLDIMKIG